MKAGGMPGGIVVQYPQSRGDRPGSHESVTRIAIAKKLAAIKRYRFEDEYDAAVRAEAHVYFVPDDTLTQTRARELGIGSEDDLFGGVVPFPFVATKTITHPLVDADAYAPAGWSQSAAARMRDIVLPGYAAFSVADARRAGARLLERGGARIKPARGIGGNGQSTVADRAELDAVLEALDPAELESYGVVIEENLEDVTTYSVGQVHVSDLLVSYCGTQRLTRNSREALVYGGSDLLVARGDFDALLGLKVPPDIEVAVAQARRYDAVAQQEFPGFIASRRNYDVAQGNNCAGERVGGVLEQSWRIGGASPAEIAAFEAFQMDPALRAVRASCIEAYGPHQPPPQAVVHFSGVDERVGLITKYSVLERA